MYVFHYSWSDVVLAIIIALLLCLFLVSITYETMKSKIDVLVRKHGEDLGWLGEEYNEISEELQDAVTYKNALQECAAIFCVYEPKEHAMRQLATILRMAEKMALDTAISKPAQQLIVKAKREHGKKVRKAADRKLERTEREYEARINAMHTTISSMQQSNTTIRANMGEIRAELSAFQGIVGQALENFVRLPSVRNKMLAAINQQHKAWKEL